MGKEAYRGLFGERPELGPQERTLPPATGLFVLPSTSPANAAVPYAERLRRFRELRAWIEPEPREAVRALILDAEGRALLCRFVNRVTGAAWWGTPGGGIEPGESAEAALRRELREETGLEPAELGPVVFRDEVVLPWQGRLLRQANVFYLVRIASHDPSPTVDLRLESVEGLRWWTLQELERLPAEELAPPQLVEVLRALAHVPSRP